MIDTTPSSDRHVRIDVNIANRLIRNCVRDMLGTGCLDRAGESIVPGLHHAIRIECRFKVTCDSGAVVILLHIVFTAHNSLHWNIEFHSD